MKTPDIDPDIERLRMAREIRREHWGQQYDLGLVGRTVSMTRKQWIETQLRIEGLI